MTSPDSFDVAGNGDRAAGPSARGSVTTGTAECWKLHKLCCNKREQFLGLLSDFMNHYYKLSLKRHFKHNVQI